jgi:membrane protein
MQNARHHLVQTWRFARLIARQFQEDRCNRVAQALSYTTLLAVVPFTTVAFAILSVFPVFQQWMGTIQSFIYSHFVPTAGDVVQKYLVQFSAKSAQLTAIGLVFLIVTALMLMDTIEYTFNEIWRVSTKRSALYRFLTYWAILTLGPILLVTSLSLTSYLVSLPLFRQDMILSTARQLLLSSLPFIFEVLAFMLLYAAVPHTRIRIQHAVIGSVFTAVLFEIAKRSFAFFVVHYSSYRLIYGAIATLPVFMIWVYLSWVIILIGAIFVASLPRYGRLDERVEVSSRKASDAGF